MEKKSIILIVIAILVVIGGVMAYNTFNNTTDDTHVKVGDATFELPSGFHEGKTNNAGDVNITNGYDSVFIKEYDHGNVTKCINDYKKYKNNTNQTVKVSTVDINNITVYKSSIVNETNTIHYWFDYKDKVYSIYTWGGTDGGSDNIESIASDLIKSLN